MIVFEQGRPQVLDPSIVIARSGVPITLTGTTDPFNIPLCVIPAGTAEDGDIITFDYTACITDSVAGESFGQPYLNSYSLQYIFDFPDPGNGSYRGNFSLYIEKAQGPLDEFGDYHPSQYFVNNNSNGFGGFGQPVAGALQRVQIDLNQTDLAFSIQGQLGDVTANFSLIGYSIVIYRQV
jgi:hypothetical protein